MHKIGILNHIQTPPDWKKRLLARAEQSGHGRRPAYRRLSVTAAASLLLLGLISGTALASAFARGGFLAGFFVRKAAEVPGAQAYMDTAQLSEITGATIGTVVDTDELRIDVMDVVSSGSDAVAALRVTAKQLDTVLRDNGWDEVPLNNYQFGSDTEGTLFEAMESDGIQYIYSDEAPSLAANQLYLILQISSLEGFTDGPYTVELRSFGYYDRSNGARITTVYPGPWTFGLDLGGDTAHSRTLFLGQSVSAGGYEYCIENVYLTPFRFIAVISCEGESDISAERFQTFWEAVSDLSLVTAAGEAVEGAVTAGSGGENFPESTCQAALQFQVPVNVEHIAAVHIFGQDYPLPPPASGSFDAD